MPQPVWWGGSHHHGTPTKTHASNGDGLVNSGGTLTVTGSIIAGNQTGPNCSGTISAVAGHNLDSGTTCGLSMATDLIATDPLLAPLAACGGPTLTMALLAASPAIDHGGSAANGCPATDQRSVARPQGTACDIGAYKSNGPVSVSTVTATITPGEPTLTPTPMNTPTPTSTTTPTPTPTTSGTPAATAKPRACVGNCTLDGTVTVDKILAAVKNALTGCVLTTATIDIDTTATTPVQPGFSGVNDEVGYRAEKPLQRASRPSQLCLAALPRRE